MGNEISLIAKLQRMNLVRLLGYCIQREEKMLIYEYMPNKSFDFYLVHPSKQALIDWREHFEIIEGITRWHIQPGLFAHSKHDFSYMSPKYAMEGLFSVKAVYNFGVLLLEINGIKCKKTFEKDSPRLEEFKNGISLIAKLQRMNLVRLLDYCIQREEKMLIYEYMPNKSFDFYVVDPSKQAQIDWRKHFEIIEGFQDWSFISIEIIELEKFLET
ncbi:receptor kinase 3 [Prunus dulcis]|uniref:Receptor kinase 3 n=1 Tax=Prunus dulcis TaxID=3755 RepID=A0A5H2XPC2_PRUDU|nr:receptor kinase 3 [Prunus dulcis]